MSGLNREPALTIGGTTALVQAGLALLISFGVDVSPEQHGTIMAFATLVIGTVAAVLIRMHVFAPSSVEKLKGDAGAKAAPAAVAPHDDRGAADAAALLDAGNPSAWFGAGGLEARRRRRERRRRADARAARVHFIGARPRRSRVPVPRA